MSDLLAITLIMVLVATTGLIITIVLAVRTRQFLAGAVRVPGTIVDVTSYASRDRNSGRRTRMYRPVFSFVGPDGTEHSLTSSTSSNVRPTVGEAVTILVPPDHPQKARIDRFFPVWGSTMVFGIITVAFSIPSAILIGVVIR